MSIDNVSDASDTQNFSIASFTFLSSLHNNVTTAIAVNKSTDGPLQVEMPPRVLPQLMTTNAVGRTIINHSQPKKSKDSFSMFEMCAQGSIHHGEFQHVWGPSDIESQPVPATEPSFKCHWSHAITALADAGERLRPDYGQLSERESIRMNLSEFYESKFSSHTF